MDEHPYRAAQPHDDAEALLRQKLLGDLTDGEELVWVGRPAQGLVFERSDYGRTAFGAVWTAFACFWEAMVLGGHAPFWFRLWGIPFIGAGLYQLIGRFFFEAQRRQRTTYGLTNRRALLLVEGNTRKLTSVDLSRSEDVNVEENADGSGSIIFGRPVTFSLNNNSQRPAPPTFVRVDNVRDLFRQLTSAQQKLLPSMKPTT